MDRQAVIEATCHWISKVVIGLNLCPFARRVFQADLIRYTVTAATVEEELLAELGAELQALVGVPATQTETTLLIHPRALGNFLDFNDFLADADQLVATLGLRGVIQIASFHPEYQFAGTKPDAVENYTNRSPYPMLHLLREESITKVAGDPDELLEIPRRNVETLRKLGRAKVMETCKGARVGGSE